MYKYKRILTEDDEELVLAIKQGKHDSLTNFQEYWQKRCGNPEYLYSEQIHSILTGFALNNFLKVDWYNYQENIRNKLYFSEVKKVGFEELNNALLQVIQVMRMYYTDAKYEGEITGFKKINEEIEPITDCGMTTPFTTTNTEKYYNKSEV